MHYIRLTSLNHKDCLRYFNVKDIKVLNSMDGSTEIYTGEERPFIVKETPEQIFNLISEVLHANGEEFLYIHEGVKANREHPEKVKIVKM